MTDYNKNYDVQWMDYNNFIHHTIVRAEDKAEAKKKIIANRKSLAHIGFIKEIKNTAAGFDLY